MSNHSTRFFLTLFLLCGFATKGYTQIREDSNVPADLKAVIALNVDFVGLLKTPLVKKMMALPPSSEQMPFQPTDVNRFSLLVSAPKTLGPEMVNDINFYAYVRFSNADVGNQVKKLMVDEGGAEATTLNGVSVLKINSPEVPVNFYVEFDGPVMVIGTEKYLTSPSKQFASKNLADSYARLKSVPIRLAVDLDGARPLLDQVSGMLKQGADPVSAQFIDLINLTSSLTLSTDIDKVLLSVGITGHNQEESQKIKTAMDAAIGMAKGMIGFAPEAKPIQPVLDGINVGLEGNTISIDIPKPDGFEALIDNAIREARIAAMRASDSNNFKQVLIAMHNYHDTMRKFPFEEHLKGEDDATGLSCMVRMLPYLEANALYESFDLKASFDSPQNSPLAKTVPEFLKLNSGGTIRWVRPTNPPQKFASILDGASNTIAFVQDRSVGMEPWTKPKSIKPADVLKQFKSLKDGEFMIVGFYDGAVGTLTNKDLVSNVEAMLEPDDGKAPKVDGDGIRAPGPGPGGIPNAVVPKGGDRKGDDPFGKSDDDPFGK